MNTNSLQTKVALQLLNYSDLPAADRYVVDERIYRFQQAWGKEGFNADFDSYCTDLAPHVSRILKRELLHEDHHLHHKRLDQSLYATYTQKVEQAMVETLFVEHISNDDDPAPDADQPLPTIPGYEIQEQIGRGGTANVYRAIQLRFDRVVALKVPFKATREPEQVSRKRFYDEARLQAKYLGAGVPAVFECSFFGDDRVPYIAMEYIDGERLEELFPKSPPDRAHCLEGFRLIAKVCRALEPLHKDQTLHLDLSAGNVYLDRQNNVKILDFGFGYAIGYKPIEKMVAGTPDYMAPEKAIGVKQYQPTTDVFSVGVFLFRMATGQLLLPKGLHNDEKLALLRSGRYVEALQVLSSAEKARNLPQPLIELTRQCLAETASNRPIDAGAVADRIDQFFKAEEDELQSLQIHAARQQVVRRSLAAVLGVVAIGMLCSIFFAIWANSERQRAERNVQLRIEALDTIVGVAASDIFVRAGQSSVQKALLLPLIGLIDQAAKSEKNDVASLEQKALALNAFSVIHQSMQQADLALQEAGQAEAILRKLEESKAASPLAKMGLAISLGNQATLLGMAGQLDLAINKVEDACKRMTALTDANSPPQVHYRQMLFENTWANCLMRQAELNPAAPDAAAKSALAITHYRSALNHINKAVSLNPLNSQFRSWNIKVLCNFALMAPDEEKLGYVRDAIKQARELVAEYPDDIASRESLAVAVTNEGEIRLKFNQPKEAIAPLREARDLYLALAAQVPMNTEFTWCTGMSDSNLGAAEGATATVAQDMQTAMNHLKNADTVYQSLRKAGVGADELQRYIDQNNARILELNKRIQALPAGN